jgi:carbamoyltransferase
MHEEPIVCSPQDAARAFKESNLDYLAIGNYLVKNLAARISDRSETAPATQLNAVL